MIGGKIKRLLFTVVLCLMILLWLWRWTETRVENARVLAWSECRRQQAEDAKRSAEHKNKRIIKNAQRKLEVLSRGDVGFDALLDLLRRGEL